MNAAPLPDLHRHLDGSLRAETLNELAAALGVHVADSSRHRIPPSVNSIASIVS